MEKQGPVESEYAFPLDNKASLRGMEVVVGDRTIVADLEEKQAVRAGMHTPPFRCPRASSPLTPAA
jgi:hypothetical protein